MSALIKFIVELIKALIPEFRKPQEPDEVDYAEYDTEVETTIDKDIRDGLE